jgi:hypothetical protein
MKHCPKIKKYCIYILILSSIQINSQVLLQDDFGARNDYWYWRSDGNQDQPVVIDGMLQLRLVNAVDSFYCNTEIYDPTEPYLPGTQVRVRLKCSEIHTGSRGWGFWDGDLDSSIILDFDVAWVMQQGSNLLGDQYNWFFFGVDGNILSNRKTFNLQNIVDETEWHTYKIVWSEENVSFYVDDQFLFQSFEDLPDEKMRMDIWIDNRVIPINNPTNFTNNISDYSEMLVDFVEITGLDGPGIERELSGDIIVWDSPNSFPNGERETSYKYYNFDINNTSEALIFVTGSAEYYGNSFEDDDIKIVLNNFDFGWNSENSLNGSELNGKGKSIVFTSQMNLGENNLQIHTDITPFLRDVIILNSAEGKTLFSNNYNQTIDSEDGLWETIEFDSHNSNFVTILISGTGKKGDALRFEINDTDFGWEGENSIDGNNLNNIPNTVVLTENLSDGKNFLKIHKRGNPQIYSVAAYGSSNISNVKNINQLPDVLSLNVYPNPFNIEAVITYTTNSASQNKLKIYNSLGENVATLVNKFQSKGSYKLNWNADHQSSGIYFCILEADNYFTVEKLILLK